MKISRENIAHYYILHLEGKLDPGDAAELMLFLSQNPGLDPLDETGPPAYSNGIHFLRKDLLKKDYQNIISITEENFEEFCIARMEGQLGRDDIQRLEGYIRLNPEKEKESQLISLLRLEPDEKVKFRRKAHLKKSVPFTPWRKILIPVAVAASLAAVWLLVPGDDGKIETPVVATITKSGITEQNQATLPLENETPASSESDNTMEEQEYSSVVNEASGITESGSTAPEPALLQPEGEAEIIADPGDAKEQHALMQADEALAVMDSESISLDRIDPVNTDILLAQADNNGILTREYLRNDNLSFTERALLSRAEIVPEISDIDFWQATVLAVKGFNILTEADIFVERIPGDDGKVKISLGAGEKTLFAARFRSEGM